MNVTNVNGSVKEELRLWGLRLFLKTNKKRLSPISLCVFLLIHALGSPPHWSDIYHTIYNAEIFLLPLIVVLATHIKIYVLLTRL